MQKKKCCCKLPLILLAILGVTAGGCYLFKDKIMEKVFNSKYEDKILALLDTGRLVWDLVRWPIDYVRAILP